LNEAVSTAYAARTDNNPFAGCSACAAFASKPGSTSGRLSEPPCNDQQLLQVERARSRFIASVGSFSLSYF
jgi:hypothetical protein